MPQRHTMHIQSRRAVHAALKARVCSWTGMSETDYATLQYENGLLYLKAYLPGDAWGIANLERSKTFWGWWRNEWGARDAAFCDSEDGNPPGSRSLLRQLYGHLHDPALLAAEVYPGGVVMAEGYNQMVAQYNKEEVANG